MWLLVLSVLAPAQLAMALLDAKSTASYGAAGIFHGQINDVVSPVNFTSTIGLSVTNEYGISIGLDYNLISSGDQTSHPFTAMFK